MEIFLFAGGAVLLGALLLVVVPYNLLVRDGNHCTESWSNVDTELKRRHDLIPNLVETVKGYAAHERETLTRLVELRERCRAQEAASRERADRETELSGAISRVFARAEAYPDLKASASFLELQRELVNTEDRIQAALRFFNGNVREYNNRVEMFPSNLVASAFGFRSRAFFEVRAAEIRQAPQVRM